MDELRSLIQTRLEEIQDLEVSSEVPDDIIETNKTYFSYTLQKNYQGSDSNKNFTYEIFLEGFIKRKETTEENTLQIVDNFQDEIEEKLKELNIKTSFRDVEVLIPIHGWGGGDFPVPTSSCQTPT